MNQELNTYKMTITVKCDDRIGNLRNWVSDAIWSGLDNTNMGEDILDFEIEQIVDI